MTDLPKFLLARIDEDEDRARSSQMSANPARPSPLLFSATRVIAECDVRRRIVEQLQQLLGPDEPDVSPEYDDGYIDALDFATRLLALPYADHPDYQQEWKP